MKSYIYLIIFLVSLNIVYSAHIVVYDEFIHANGSITDGRLWKDDNINFKLENVSSNTQAICFDWNNTYPNTYNYSTCFYDLGGNCNGTSYYEDISHSVEVGGCLAPDTNCEIMFDKRGGTWGTVFDSTDSIDTIIYINYSILDVSHSYQYWFNENDWDNIITASWDCYNYSDSTFVTFIDINDMFGNINYVYIDIPSECTSDTPFRLKLNAKEDTDGNNIFRIDVEGIIDLNGTECGNSTCSSSGIADNMHIDLNDGCPDIEDCYEGFDVTDVVCDGCEYDTSVIGSYNITARYYENCETNNVRQYNIDGKNGFNWVIGDSQAYECNLDEGTYGGSIYDYVLNYSISDDLTNISAGLTCDTGSNLVCSEYFDDMYTSEKFGNLDIPCRLIDNQSCNTNNDCASNICNATIYYRYICNPIENQSTYDLQSTGGVGTFYCTNSLYEESDWVVDSGGLTCNIFEYCDTTQHNITNTSTPTTPCVNDKSEGDVCTRYSIGYLSEPECEGYRVCDSPNTAVSTNTGECNLLLHKANITSSITDDDLNDDFKVRIGLTIGLTAKGSNSTAIRGYEVGFTPSFNISGSCWDFDDDGTYDKYICGKDSLGNIINCPSALQIKNNVCSGITEVTDGYFGDVVNFTEYIDNNYTVSVIVFDGWAGVLPVNISKKAKIHLIWTNGTTINITNEGESDVYKDFVTDRNNTKPYIAVSGNSTTCKECTVEYACIKPYIINLTTINYTFIKCFQKTGTVSNSSFCNTLGCSSYQSVTNPKDSIVNITYDLALSLSNNDSLFATSPFSIILRVINNYNETFQQIRNDVQFKGYCLDNEWSYGEASSDYGGDCGTCYDKLLSPLLNETDIDYGGRCGYCKDDVIYKNNDVLFDLITEDLDIGEFITLNEIGNLVPIIPIYPDSKYCKESEGVLGGLGLFVTILTVLMLVILFIIFTTLSLLVIFFTFKLFVIYKTYKSTFGKKYIRKIIKKYK